VALGSAAGRRAQDGLDPDTEEPAMRTRPTPPPEPGTGHDDVGGLDRDLARLIGRRRLLAVMGGAGAGVALAACGLSSDDASSGTTSTSTSTSRSGSSDGGIPQETEGPYPGDGSNGPDVLLEPDVVRRDITRSIGSASGVAEGVPLTMTLTVVDASTGDPLPGTAVYLWHCTREGGYSMYSEGIEDESFLRGVQEADSDGSLTFETIVPGCYAGRWPHVHFEVYEDLATATSSGAIRRTSQLAFPQDVCEVVYAEEGYEDSLANLSGVSLESDGIFADGVDQQVVTITGSPSAGYAATLTVPV
jgi:protocatechuate 3,4-dioxygenase beta subunit